MSTIGEKRANLRDTQRVIEEYSAEIVRIRATRIRLNSAFDGGNEGPGTSFCGRHQSMHNVSVVLQRELSTMSERVDHLQGIIEALDACRRSIAADLATEEGAAEPGQDPQDDEEPGRRRRIRLRDRRP